MFNKFPSVPMPDHLSCDLGWENIGRTIDNQLKSQNSDRPLVVLECYHGVRISDIQAFGQSIGAQTLMHSQSAMKEAGLIEQMVHPDVTDDRIFGRMTFLNLDDFFDEKKVAAFHQQLEQISNGLVVIAGIGASLLAPHWDVLVYADMARWEIQARMRKGELDNIGVQNRGIDVKRLYKQGYFVDWRVCDKLKKRLYNQMDFVLDTNTSSEPKMISGAAFREGLSMAIQQPFSVVPFFDPGVWGGQWMKEVCDLDPSPPNYAWCFNCVPEENSLLLRFGEHVFETPAVNLVFYEPEPLLGQAVFGRFGDEFPIRFDFLDTMDGANLSLQVHPMTTYIKEHFGMPYTQDESYYLMEAGDNAHVYLGLTDDADPEEMIYDLKRAEKGEITFDAERYVNTWPVEKHDHVLIPAGTVHCSGKDCMVLEISATPYIFTFKLWDWGRLGMDGLPRPINIDHGKNVIQWNRRTQWTKDNLINQVEAVKEGPGYIEERTGLHELEFIETRRHWFTDKIAHDTRGNLNVLCLVEGSQAVVTSPSAAFDPFVVNYAEVFIVPAQIGRYDIAPHGEGIGQKLATVKAFVRT